MHARGFGAHGYFENYESLADITRADLFQRPGEQTPAFVRFSTVAGNKGSADLARDVRGFAVKLYTKEGNWDLVGNNIPVFFIQDAIKFPDLDPRRQAGARPRLPAGADRARQLLGLRLADARERRTCSCGSCPTGPSRARSGSWRASASTPSGSSTPTGKSTFVKFHWKPKLGLQSVVWNEAVKINGADPDFHRRDLWDAIQTGDFPEWELGLQLFDDDFADQFDFDVLDATKLIPEEEVPVRRVGRLVLDRVVDNFFAETEQVAFCTQNIVPGIDFTNDPLLQGRNFSYLDTQLKRLGGPNFTHLPVNAPKCPFAHFQQDGHMAMHNPKGRVNYEPNSWTGDARRPARGSRSGASDRFPAEEEGAKRRRPLRDASPTTTARPGSSSSARPPIEQQHIADAFTFELSKVETPAIRARMVAHLRNVDDGPGRGGRRRPRPDRDARAGRRRAADADQRPAAVAGAEHPRQRPADASPAARSASWSPTASTPTLLDGAAQGASTAEGALVELVAPKIGGVDASDGSSIAGRPEARRRPVGALRRRRHPRLRGRRRRRWPPSPAARDFVADAFAHCKFIGYTDAAMPLLDAAGLAGLDEGFIELDGNAADFISRCRQLRHWAPSDGQRLSGPAGGTVWAWRKGVRRSPVASRPVRHEPAKSTVDIGDHLCMTDREGIAATRPADRYFTEFARADFRDRRHRGLPGKRGRRQHHARRRKAMAGACVPDRRRYGWGPCVRGSPYGMTASPTLIADRYQRLQLLGEGGMGRVWLGLDTKLNRTVALKEVRPAEGHTEADLREVAPRALREARAAARLSHPNAVRVYDIVATEPAPWIVMEYVPSRSLNQVVAENGPLDPAVAARYGLDVLAALTAAHQVGVVHRDVKPSNVLITEADRAVLTDFGVATIVGDPAVTRSGVVIGSPSFMAPERVADQAVGPEADLWSLGATLYFAVVGHSPLRASLSVGDPGRSGHRGSAVRAGRRSAVARPLGPAASRPAPAAVRWGRTVHAVPGLSRHADVDSAPARARAPGHRGWPRWRHPRDHRRRFRCRCRRLRDAGAGG